MGFFDFKNKKSASVIGVDIGASSIKIVQLRKRRGVALLETYGEIALGPYHNAEIGQATNPPASKVAEALRDLLKEANVTTKKAGVSIPFSSSLISLISMPAIGTKQLSSMVPIEARKYIPVPISEVTLDWFVVPDEEKSFSEDSEESEEEEKSEKKVNVLLVAIHNNVLNKYSEIVKAAGLDVGFFEIEIFSSIRAIVGQSITPTMILDMGSANTKLYIVEYGIVKVSHVIGGGAQDITQTLSRSLGMSISKAEELKRESGIIDDLSENAVQNSKEVIMSGLNRMFGEANRILKQYQQKQNKNVGNVILTGGGATMKGLLPLAEKYLETKVSLSDPFSNIESPAFFEGILKEVGPEFTVAVGLAVRKLREEE